MCLWRMYLGDSVEQIDKIESDSIGLSVFSPPFPGMYAYTNSPHDMGNVKSIEEMVNQFRFLIGKEKLLRIVRSWSQVLPAPDTFGRRTVLVIKN